MNTSRQAGFVVVLLLTASTALLGADWPQFRGPNRDGKSLEENLLKVWPEGGPRLLWTANGLGEGWSSAAVRQNRIYITGMETKREFLFAIGSDGRQSWKREYGSAWKSNSAGDWVCLDWNTGKVAYEQSWRGNKGPVIFADEMLYCYDEDTGHVALVKASDEEFEPVSSFQVTLGKGKFWAHPSIADGRLYLRHGEFLMAYDIKAK